MTIQKLSLQLWLDLKRGVYPAQARRNVRHQLRQNYSANPKGKGAKAWKRLELNRKQSAATCVWL